MFRKLLIVGSASLAMQLCSHVYAQTQTHTNGQDTEVMQRIERIENGLLQPVLVRGAPAHTMRLSDRMKALQVPAVSIAMINHGTIEWARAYGVANVQAGVAVTPDTLFQVASLSKPVAATLAMRLAQTGKLKLDEDVNRGLLQWHLPDSAFSAQQPVTVRTLLSHTAGLSGYNLLGYGNNQAVPGLLQVLQGVAPASNPAVKVESLPGSRYAYSSLGYAVLEQYISDLTRQSFAGLAQDMVLQPLGMRHTLFAQTLPASRVAHAASGHELDGSVVPGNWRQHPELAAAGMWSTASDLAKFVIAIQRAAVGQDNTLLNQSQVTEMLKPVRNDYGLGFELEHDGVETAFHHSGSNKGYKALMFAYTKTGQGVVILTNGDAGWPLIEDLMRSIAHEYGWEDYRPIVRDSSTVNPALFEQFSGEFNVANTKLRIFSEGNQLFVAGPPIGPTPAQLIPAGAYDYFLREKDATLHFDANGSAPVETLTFFDGKARPGKRQASAK